MEEEQENHLASQNSQSPREDDGTREAQETPEGSNVHSTGACLLLIPRVLESYDVPGHNGTSGNSNFITKPNFTIEE